MMPENNQETSYPHQQGTLPARRSRQRALHHQPEARADLRRVHRRLQARLGRPRHAAERDLQRADSALQVDRRAAAARRRTSCPTCTSSRSRRTGWSTSASAARTGSRCSPPKASSAGVLRVAEHAGAAARAAAGSANTKMPPCGTTYKLAISRDPQQKYPLRRRRHEQQGVDPRPPERQDARVVRRQRPLRRPAALDQRDRDGLEGQHLHGRGRAGQAHPEVRAGHGEQAVERTT